MSSVQSSFPKTIGHSTMEHSVQSQVDPNDGKVPSTLEVEVFGPIIGYSLIEVIYSDY